MLKSSDLKKVFPKRLPQSHKGENGKVLIIGGSIDYHGAPLFSAMGALYSGADLVYLAVPECNFNVTRGFSPDFLVRKYNGDYLTSKVFDTIATLAAKADVMLIGPGLGDRKETLEAVKKIVTEINLPTVLDASAIQVLPLIEKLPLRQKIVITPHHGEFEILTEKPSENFPHAEQKFMLMRPLAVDLKLNILLKGQEDLIVAEDGKTARNVTGNAGMTVGGSGDVLSGVVAGLLAQGADPFSACQIAAFAVGKTGDKLLKEKGYGFSASDLAHELPYILKELMD